MLAATLAILMSQPQDLRGPISPVEKLPVVGKQAVQAGSAPHAVNPNDRGPQVGKWIWSTESIHKAIRFRKTFTLNEAPKKVRGWIAADVRYRMWINGVLASRGPADVGRDYDSPPCGPWFEDVRDLTRFFVPGKNVIAVEVLPFAVVGNEWPLDHPGLKVDLEIEGVNKTRRVVATDSTWRCITAEDLDQAGAKNGFRFNMAAEPVGWQESDFDDVRWKAAVVTDNQIPTLVSELAPPLEAILPSVGVTRVSRGVSANPHTGGATFSHDGSYTVQYGHILSGYVGLKVHGHDGARLLIMPNEHDAPGHNREAEIILREGEQTVEIPYFDSFSVVNIQAEDVVKPIQIEDVRCVFTSYPVQYRGSFSCSSPEFTRLWEVCRWCTQICMQTHHLDSPHHQEPVSDAGDYLIESLNGFYTFGDGTLIRQDLKKIARNLEQRHYQSFHTSYSLMWLQMLMQYFDYTGDASAVRELAPTAFALLDRFEGYIGANGLVSNAPNYMFMDWVEIEGFTAHHPPAVIGQGYMTSLYYRALADGIRVAEMLHDEARAEKCRQLRGKIAEAFERELWIPEKGLYRDGKPFVTSIAPNSWLPADKDIETFTTQGNTFAVACGLVPKERSRQVMEKIISRTDLHCQPYFMHFVFQALSTAGLFNEQAVAQLSKWHIVPDTQSFLEMWNTGDLSHAWIGTPIYQMSGQILGVNPTSPGFATFAITPHPCDLKWARGVVPTPHGLIGVWWKKVRGGYELQFVVPEGTIANVEGKSYGPGRHRTRFDPGFNSRS